MPKKTSHMCYSILYASPGLPYGMVIDWMTPSGNYFGFTNILVDLDSPKETEMIFSDISYED